ASIAGSNARVFSASSIAIRRLSRSSLPVYGTKPAGGLLRLKWFIGTFEISHAYARPPRADRSLAERGSGIIPDPPPNCSAPRQPPAPSPSRSSRDRAARPAPWPGKQVRARTACCDVGLREAVLLRQALPECLVRNAGLRLALELRLERVAGRGEFVA